MPCLKSREAGTCRTGGKSFRYFVIGLVVGGLVSHAVISLPSFEGAKETVIRPATPSVTPSREHSTTSNTALARHESLGFFDDISDEEWKLLKERVHEVYPNVKGGNPNQLRLEQVPAYQFFQDHYEPDFNCRHERRVGELGDGGKWVCDPHRYRAMASDGQPRPCLVYSVGSHGETSFERAVLEQIGKHCEVHTFDMEDYSKVVTEAGAIFHQWGISGKTEGQFKTLKDTMEELGHLDRPIDIFKIDCEGCEWATYPSFFEGGIGAIRQLLIELHGTGKRLSATMKAPDAVDFFQAMYQHGYVITHKEVNIISSSKYGVFCIEYAFLHLHKDFFKGIPGLSR